MGVDRRRRPRRQVLTIALKPELAVDAVEIQYPLVADLHVNTWPGIGAGRRIGHGRTGRRAQRKRIHENDARQ